MGGLQLTEGEFGNLNDFLNSIFFDYVNGSTLSQVDIPIF